MKSSSIKSISCDFTDGLYKILRNKQKQCLGAAIPDHRERIIGSGRFPPGVIVKGLLTEQCPEHLLAFPILAASSTNHKFLLPVFSLCCGLIPDPQASSHKRAFMFQVLSCLAECRNIQFPSEIMCALYILQRFHISIISFHCATTECMIIFLILVYYQP